LVNLQGLTGLPGTGLKDRKIPKDDGGAQFGYFRVLKKI